MLLQEELGFVAVKFFFFSNFQLFTPILEYNEAVLL